MSAQDFPEVAELGPITAAELRRARLYAADDAARLMANATTPQAVAEACMPATLLDRLVHAYRQSERASEVDAWCENRPTKQGAAK